MRSLLLGLLLVNILFWVWSSYVAKPHQRSSGRYDAHGLPSLELAKSDSLSAVVDDAVIVNGAGTTDVIDVDDDRSNSDPLAETPITITPQEGSPEPLTAAVASQAAISLSESGTLLRNVDPIEFPAACFSVGPFIGLEQANRGMASLTRAGVNVRERVEEAEVWVGHWVHLPAFSSRDAAVAEVERLRKEGIKDIYIEPSGELANTVSLGLFSDLARAEIRAGKLRKLEVRPQIADRHREGLVYWLDLALDAGFSLDLAAFEKVPNQEIRQEQADCQSLQLGNN